MGGPHPPVLTKFKHIFSTDVPFRTHVFLDAIASSSCYPCEWVSEWVSESVIISDLPSISVIVGYLSLPTCLLTYSQSTGPYHSTGPFPANWSLPNQLVPSQSPGPFPVNWSPSQSTGLLPVNWSPPSQLVESSPPSPWWVWLVPLVGHIWLWWVWWPYWI